MRSWSLLALLALVACGDRVPEPADTPSPAPPEPARVVPATIPDGPAVYGVVVTEFGDPLPDVDVVVAGELLGRTNVHGEFCVFPAARGPVAFRREGFREQEEAPAPAGDTELLVRLPHVDQQVEPYRWLLYAKAGGHYGVPGVRCELFDHGGARRFAEGITRADGSLLYTRPDDFLGPISVRLTGPGPDQVREWKQNVAHGGGAYVANHDRRITVHVRPRGRATYGTAFHTGFLCAPGPMQGGRVRGPFSPDAEWVRATSGTRRPTAIAVWARGPERVTLRTTRDPGAELDVELPATAAGPVLWFDSGTDDPMGARPVLRVDPRFVGVVRGATGPDSHDLSDTGVLDVPLVADAGRLRASRLDVDDDVTLSLRSRATERDVRLLARLPVAPGIREQRDTTLPLRVAAGTSRLLVRYVGPASGAPAVLVVRRRGGGYVRAVSAEPEREHVFDGLCAGVFTVYLTPDRGAGSLDADVAAVSRVDQRCVVVPPGAAVEHTATWPRKLPRVDLGTESRPR